jgi:hypothetical protein
MVEVTTRFGLPLLVPGQGQKDVTHNEALLALDLLAHAAALSRTLAVPPGDPAIGACWLVPADASGVWAGASGRLACWTAAGWRFVDFPDGAALWVADEALRVRRAGSAWVPEAPAGAPLGSVAAPSGGTVVDVEARAALALLLERLRQLRLIEG